MSKQTIVVLGGGTAGSIAALSLRKSAPRSVRILQVYSSKIGTIGVGEGSLRQLPEFLHGYLGIDPRRFFREVEPTWKLGIRFKWGSSADFKYSFSPQVCVTHPHKDLPRPLGFYCHGQMRNHAFAASLMDCDFAFLKDADDGPALEGDYGYHMDNRKLAAFLEQYAKEQGIELIDAEVDAVKTSEVGVESIRLNTGQEVAADLFVDCSGFRSLLLGDALKEPFVSYRSSLYCDRALVGGWSRTNEPVHPYTTSESMECGWCWQIELPERINRGYVFASDFISDDEAEAEFRAKNPKITDTNLVKFRSGRYDRAWVKNVVAIGNSAGFVEPLEATAIAAICSASKMLGQMLGQAGGCSVGPRTQTLFNQRNDRSWDTIADFLAVHYRFNQRITNDFWRSCNHDVDLRGAESIVSYYRENGPCDHWKLLLEDPLCRFRLDGYYTLLIGQQVPHAKLDTVTRSEREAFRNLQRATKQYASQGISVTDSLKAVNNPSWRWRPAHFGIASATR